MTCLVILGLSGPGLVFRLKLPSLSYFGAITLSHISSAKKQLKYSETPYSPDLKVLEEGRQQNKQ